VFQDGPIEAVLPESRACRQGNTRSARWLVNSDTASCPAAATHAEHATSRLFRRNCARHSPQSQPELKQQPITPPNPQKRGRRLPGHHLHTPTCELILTKPAAQHCSAHTCTGQWRLRYHTTQTHDCTTEYATSLRHLQSLPSQQFQALFNSLFKVLCIFPSRYLFAIGLSPVFSFRWNLPPTLSCTPKQPDSLKACLTRALPSQGRDSHPPW